MLSDDEVKLMAHAYALRHDEEGDIELWFCPGPDLFAEAARMWASGRLERRWLEGDLLYRMSDAAWQAQRLLAVMADANARSN